MLGEPMFDFERIYAAAILGGEVDYHLTLDSTNTRALELGQDAALVMPLLVLTEEQTAGRGRGTNRWWTASGGITFSLLVDALALKIPTAQWPQLSLVCGLAVCQALEQLIPQGDFSLKWPNDVYASGRKVCGLLIEAVPGKQQRLVIGIGINVNTRFADAPEEVRGKATSLAEEGSAESLDLTSVLVTVLETLMQRLNDLAREGFAPLRECWQVRSFLTGRTIGVQIGEKVVRGECLGLAEGGSLQLLTEAGLVDVWREVWWKLGSGDKAFAYA